MLKDFRYIITEIRTLLKGYIQCPRCKSFKLKHSKPKQYITVIDNEEIIVSKCETTCSKCGMIKYTNKTDKYIC